MAQTSALTTHTPHVHTSAPPTPWNLRRLKPVSKRQLAKRFAQRAIGALVALLLQVVFSIAVASAVVPQRTLGNGAQVLGPLTEFAALGAISGGVVMSYRLRNTLDVACE